MSKDVLNESMSLLQLNMMLTGLAMNVTELPLEKRQNISKILDNIQDSHKVLTKELESLKAQNKALLEACKWAQRLLRNVNCSCEECIRCRAAIKQATEGEK